MREEYSKEVCDNFTRFILEMKDHYDICEIHGQREGSLLLNYFRDTADIWSRIISDDISPVSLLPHKFEEYIIALPVQFRKNTQRALKKLSQMGYQLEKADGNNVSDFIENLITLHNDEWLQRNEKGVLNDKKVQNFLSETVFNLMQSGYSNIYALKNGNNYAAVNIIFEVNGIAYFYIGGYNSELNKYSPGSVLLWKIIEDCISRGVKKFDFLKGGENYKYRWGAKDVSINRIIIERGRI